MNIEFKDGEIFINGKRIIFPRDSNFSPSTILLGITENGEFQLANIENGKFLIKISPSKNYYFADQEIKGVLTSNFWVEFDFGFESICIVLRNDDPNTLALLEFSFDGISRHGILNPKEKQEFIFLGKSKIYLKALTSTNVTKYQVIAW